MADTCLHEKISKLFVLKSPKKKLKKKKLTWLEGRLGSLKNNQSPITHTCTHIFFFFLNVSKIFQVYHKSLWEKCILVHTKHKVAVKQLQINLQFLFT